MQAARNKTDGNSATGSGPRNTSKHRRPPNTGTASDSEPSVTGFGGVDVSDYV